jgi:hypothetical protein
MKHLKPKPYTDEEMAQLKKDLETKEEIIMPGLKTDPGNKTPTGYFPEPAAIKKTFLIK